MPYKFILVPLTIIIISQILKLVTDSIKGNFNLKSVLNSYGGMPSSHAALVASISTITAVQSGINSIPFAICLVFSILILRDATGLRMVTEKQSIAINKLIKQLPIDNQKNFALQTESVGHTYSEILAGIVLGVVLTWVLV
ncbi:MAG: divergent PAP2 family protein [Patescibacteria group bacterium]